MARCEEGYLCEVCGADVEELTDSALYLQLVIGWIDPETLHTRRECHIRCLPVLAQFIDDPSFEPPVLFDGEFDRRRLDPNFVAQRVELVTRGYQRLAQIASMRMRPSLVEYLLPECADQWS